MALEDLDCQPRYVYPNQSRAFLTDEVAAALYNSHASFLHSFIFHNLAPNRSYPALLAATEGTDDFYPVFRQVADGKIWKAQMEALLALDIPAEQIESELERYQLNRRLTSGGFRSTKDMDAKVLKGFIDKYGEAVLPFFERYIRWATEGRIKSLLALEINRAELLRELNVLARREPQAMSRISHVWAIPLYEKGSSFFESFLIRYIGRENQYVTRELLQRAEANQQKTLFRALYQIVSRGSEWENQISRFLETNPSDEALKKFLDLYDIPNWEYTLSEKTAASLYQRNPDAFMPFITKHMSRNQRWGGYTSYDRLIQAAESNSEHHLTFLKALDYQRYWKTQMETLLKSKITGEEAAQSLETLHPKDTWAVQDTQILHKVFDKFGFAVVPYMVKNIHWVKFTEAMMEKLEKIAPPALFWEAVFKTMNWHQTNSWSYRRWTKALDDFIEHPVSEWEAGMMLQLLSPPQPNAWYRIQAPEATILLLYKKYPDSARGFIQQYYSPQTESPLFRLALNNNDEELLDYLSYRAMDAINHQINQYWGNRGRLATSKAISSYQETIQRMGETVINRLEALYQRDPALYVRHAAMILAWWRPFAIWNPEGMEQVNPIYRHIATQHLSDWIEQPEGIRELLESTNIFVQLLGLNILRDAKHELVAQVILENKRIFRQLLLGRARRSTKRIVLSAIEQAIAQNPAFAAELLPILEEAADFYGRLALSEQMMISITRIKHALDQGLPVPLSYPVEGKHVGA
jgi:arsenate reductase-like glutaredoxin family protein